MIGMNRLRIPSILLVPGTYSAQSIILAKTKEDTLGDGVTFYIACERTNYCAQVSFSVLSLYACHNSMSYKYDTCTCITVHVRYPICTLPVPGTVQ
jgi:hypothetical protein